MLVVANHRSIQIPVPVDLRSTKKGYLDSTPLQVIHKQLGHRAH
jgi:hypothetical protein